MVCLCAYGLAQLLWRTKHPFLPSEAGTFRQLLWMAGKQWSAFCPPMKRCCQAAEWRWMGAGRGGRRRANLWFHQKNVYVKCVGGWGRIWNHTSVIPHAPALHLWLWGFASSGKAETMDLGANLSQICSIMWLNELFNLSILRVWSRGLEFYGRRGEIRHVVVIWKHIFLWLRTVLRVLLPWLYWMKYVCSLGDRLRATFSHHCLVSICISLCNFQSYLMVCFYC